MLLVGGSRSHALSNCVGADHAGDRHTVLGCRRCRRGAIRRAVSAYGEVLVEAEYDADALTAGEAAEGVPERRWRSLRRRGPADLVADARQQDRSAALSGGASRWSVRRDEDLDVHRGVSGSAGWRRRSGTSGTRPWPARSGPGPRRAHGRGSAGTPSAAEPASGPRRTRRSSPRSAPRTPVSRAVNVPFSILTSCSTGWVVRMVARRAGCRQKVPLSTGQAVDGAGMLAGDRFLHRPGGVRCPVTRPVAQAVRRTAPVRGNPHHQPGRHDDSRRARTVATPGAARSARG